MAQAPGNLTVQGMSIACPEGWRDNSMLALSADQPGAGGVSPTLVITREAAPEGLSPVPGIEMFVDRQLDQMRGALAGLVEVSRRRAEAANPAAELMIDWVSNGIPVTQRISYAYADATTLMIATATTGRGDFAAAEPAFRAMLQSFRFT